MIRVSLLLLASVLISACGEGSKTECVQRELGRIGYGLDQGVAIYGGANPTIVYSKNYRHSPDETSQRLVMASLTKPVVAAEVRRLADTGGFELDTPIRDLLIADWAWANRLDESVTVRHLMQHAAGFDSGLSGDPIIRRVGLGNCDEAIGIALGRKLDHKPGDVTSYSNVGYCILGKLVLLHSRNRDGDLDAALASDLGGAGGMFVSIEKLHSDLIGTLPLDDWSSSAPLPDGSYYSSGWRRWPDERNGAAPWTHFGRLPGILSVAVTDGKENVVVAHFEGDPKDPNATAKIFADRVWKCMSKPVSE